MHSEVGRIQLLVLDLVIVISRKKLRLKGQILEIFGVNAVKSSTGQRHSIGRQKINLSLIEFK